LIALAGLAVAAFTYADNTNHAPGPDTATITLRLPDGRPFLSFAFPKLVIIEEAPTQPTPPAQAQPEINNDFTQWANGTYSIPDNAVTGNALVGTTFVLFTKVNPHAHAYSPGPPNELTAAQHDEVDLCALATLYGIDTGQHFTGVRILDVYGNALVTKSRIDYPCRVAATGATVAPGG